MKACPSRNCRTSQQNGSTQQWHWGNAALGRLKELFKRNPGDSAGLHPPRRSYRRSLRDTRWWERRRANGEQRVPISAGWPTICLFRGLKRCFGLCSLLPHVVGPKKAERRLEAVQNEVAQDLPLFVA